jgi:hypothetical protein
MQLPSSNESSSFGRSKAKEAVEVPAASVGEVDFLASVVVPLVPEAAGVPVVADVPVAGDSSDY